MNKYLDRIPVVVEPLKNTDPKIKRRKFLVPSDVTMGFVIHRIREYMDHIKSKHAVTFYVYNQPCNKTVSLNNLYTYEKSYVSNFYNLSLLPISNILNNIYKHHKDSD